MVLAPARTPVMLAIERTKQGGIMIHCLNAKPAEFLFTPEKTVVGSLLGIRQQIRAVLRLAADDKVRCVCESCPLGEAGETQARLKRNGIRARAVSPRVLVWTLR